MNTDFFYSYCVFYMHSFWLYTEFNSVYASALNARESGVEISRESGLTQNLPPSDEIQNDPDFRVRFNEQLSEEGIIPSYNIVVVNL